MFRHPEVGDQLVQDVLNRKYYIEYSVHGLQHWQKVERNGLEQLELLIEACRGHTEIIHHANVTIQCCWDGDRLDLTRVSVIPEAEFLNTKTAKEIADTMDYSVLETPMD